MSERTSYAPGTPCWVDLGTPDLDASAEFYGGAVRLGDAGAARTRADRRLPPGEEERQPTSPG